MPDALTAPETLRLEILSGAKPAALQASIPEDLRKLLPPGAVLEVKVATDENGQRGIVYQGQFIPMPIPSELSDGQTLVVKVAGSAQGLFLQLLEARPLEKFLDAVFRPFTSPGASPLPRDIEQTLRQLVRDLTRTGLDTAPVPQKPLQAPPELPPALKTLPGISPAMISQQIQEPYQQVTETSSVFAVPAVPLPSVSPSAPYSDLPSKQEGSPASAVEKVFQSLIRQNIVAAAKEAQEPKALVEFLMRSSAPLMPGKVEEARQAVEEIVKAMTTSSSSPSPRPQMEAALMDALETILRAPTELSFSEKAPPLPVPFAHKLYLEAVAAVLAPSLGIRELEVLRNAVLPETRANPLLFLITTLTSFNFFPQTGGADSLSGSSDMISGLLSDLQRLRDAKASDTQIRQTLQQTLSRLKGEHTELPEKVPGSAAASATETLTALRTIIESRDTLSQLNPIMQTAGQPVLMIFPALIQGILSRWEMAFTPGTREAENEGGQKRRESGQFERVSLSLPLPSMGNVRIEIARRSEEVLVHFTFSRPEVTKFVRDRLGDLTRSLHAAGYRKAQLHAETGNPGSVSSEWQGELIKGLAIA